VLAIGRAPTTDPRLLILDSPSYGIMPRLVGVAQPLDETLEITNRAYLAADWARGEMRGIAADSGGQAGLYWQVSPATVAPVGASAAHHR
jgi:hypothetical protein